MASGHNAQGGGFTFVASVTPTVQDGVDYSTGDLIGGKLTFTFVGGHTADGATAARPTRLVNFTGIIQSVSITDKAGVLTDIDVVIFNADPSGTTFTENAVLNIVDADLTKIIGVASVTDWVSFSTNAQGDAVNLGFAFDTKATGNVLFGAMIARGAANLTGTTDLTINVGILVD